MNMFGLRFLFILFSLVFSNITRCETKDYPWITQVTRDRETWNGGPMSQKIEEVPIFIFIWAPQIEFKTLEMKPRSSLISKAIKAPATFFRKDIQQAKEQFEIFRKSYNDCRSSKTFNQSKECLKMISVCHEDTPNYPCFYEKSLMICLEKDLKCLSNDDIFPAFNQCLSTNIDMMGFMFEIYDSDAKRRPYYTIQTGINKSKATVNCSFTYFKNKYYLIELSDTTLSRPSRNIVPKEIYIRDNLYELEKRNVKRKKATTLKN